MTSTASFHPPAELLGRARTHRATLVAFVLAMLVPVPGASLAAQLAERTPRPETVRGRVTSDSGLPVREATVSATMAPDRVSRQTTTDVQGRFAITFDHGTGDYLIHVSAAGYRTERRRLTRGAADTALLLDLKLSLAAPRLAAVRVVERNPRPLRGGFQGNGVGAAEQWSEGTAALEPGQQGDLTAIANAYLGATAEENGVGVLGLGGDQSRVTLNGMAFEGGALPREARTVTTLRTSEYDPAAGGFSGAQVAVRLLPGGRFYVRTAHLTLDAPALQATGAAANRLGQQYTTVRGSIGGLGEWKPDTWYYNTALSVSQRTSGTASMLSVGDDVLQTAGIAPDSASRFRELLAAQGIPLLYARVPGSTISRSVNFVTRLDHKPGTYMQPARSTWNLTLFGALSDQQSPGVDPTQLPVFGGRREQRSLAGQYELSRYFGNTLNELRSGLSVNRTSASPYVELPGGRVLISSALGDDGARTGLEFGGPGRRDNGQQRWTWETRNETQWYTRGKPHRVKLSVGARLDGYSSSPQEQLLGAFTYPSLAALQARRPSSFSRTIAAPTRRGGAWSGFAALGDYWRVSPSFELLYGARLEGNRYLTRLADNPAVTTAFSAATTSRPDRLHVSPRAGFTWTVRRDILSINSMSATSLRGRWPAMELRGGIGEFRELPATHLLSEASVAHGLPGGLVRLSCLGAAAPTPRWEEYLDAPEAIPGECADGAPPVFSDVAPTIRLFDPSFDARRSWRANLAWRQLVGRVGLLVDGTYSLNLNQPGTVDLNFADVPRFTLGAERERPVFVSTASIDPTTGEVSAVEARSHGAFGRVVSTRSDLRSTSRQLTLTARSNIARMQYSVAYALLDVNETARGFDGSTFGTPWQRERSPGTNDVRHQIQTYVSSPLPLGMNLTLFGRASSGRPYTPSIAGDVNGDGLWNDRAFVFDPAAVSDPAVSDALRSLLLEAPRPARRCLATQLGNPAARNSCRGPWTASMNATVALYRRPTAGMRRGFDANLFISNPLGGLDQLLHGRRLHGWGSAGFPDPTLLTVRGFDPASQRFRYEVNPRFGSTRASQRILSAPFGVTLDMRFDLGIPIMKQEALQLLKPGRRGFPGTRLSIDSTFGKVRHNVPDVYALIMRESDSLLISREQGEQLRQAQVHHRGRVDSLWRATASRIASMGDDYDADAAMRLLDRAIKAAWQMGRDELPVLERILTPLQLQLAPLVPMLRDPRSSGPMFRALTF